LGTADESTGEATGMTLTTAILMLLSAMGGAALAVFAMAAFIVGGRSDDFPAARVDRKVRKKVPTPYGWVNRWNHKSNKLSHFCAWPTKNDG
jgi:hypothetical protein